MSVRRTGDPSQRTVARLTVTACAKVNLGWRVGALRPDGYHEVSGLMQTVSLADRLGIEVGTKAERHQAEVEGEPLWLRVTGEGSGELEDDSNLVVKAARVLADRVAPRPTAFDLSKAIPVAAGLGGGSADAAAALVGLNVAWKAGLSANDLVALAAEVGSDVPAILAGGLVHCSGRGEVVRRMGSATAGAFVLGISTDHIATAEAYRTLDGLLVSRDPELWRNDLEAAALALVPTLGERLAAMREASGVAFVSGSGPTVVGVAAAADEASAVADRVRDAFHDVVVCTPSDWGVRLGVGP